MLEGMTAKQIAGYLKARRDQRGSTFGGITFNDGYNVPTFGITQAVYNEIHRAMHGEYGTHGEPTNLTPAVVKKALKSNLERGGTLHATKSAHSSRRSGFLAPEVRYAGTSLAPAPRSREQIAADRRRVSAEVDRVIESAVNAKKRSHATMRPSKKKGDALRKIVAYFVYANGEFEGETKTLAGARRMAAKIVKLRDLKGRPYRASIKAAVTEGNRSWNEDVAEIV
jgi:hypothetical protein